MSSTRSILTVALGGRDGGQLWENGEVVPSLRLPVGTTMIAKNEVRSGHAVGPEWDQGEGAFPKGQETEG